MARLKTLEFDAPLTPLPDQVRDLLNDADQRIEAFQFKHRDTPVASFVPSDFVLAYHALSAIAALVTAGYLYFDGTTVVSQEGTLGSGSGNTYFPSGWM